MFGIADYGAFVVAVIVFLAIPGPGNLALLGATGQGGVRSGLAATLGVIAGDQALLWLAVSGLSALLATYPAAFQTIQWAGAIYLVWLGAKLLRTRLDDAPSLVLKSDHFFKQAFFITVLNPKAIVFYMAFFPLFVNPAQHQGAITFAVMAVTIAALTLIYGIAIVMGAHLLSRRANAHRIVGFMLNKITGLLLISFGLKMALFK
jgi:leucine efflux protein